jgi:hypothetical protein
MHALPLEEHRGFATCSKDTAVLLRRNQVIIGKLLDGNRVTLGDGGVDDVGHGVIVDEQPKIPRTWLRDPHVRVMDDERPLRRVADGNAELAVPQRRIPVVPEHVLPGLRVVDHVGAVVDA